jgi:GNAT superfamily N-acetyltransferase
VDLTFSDATDADGAAMALLRTGAASVLAARFGPGPWSPPSYTVALRLAAVPGRSCVRLGRRDGTVVSGLRLQTKKPWAIDVTWFSPAARPLYLTDMVVDPEYQRMGFGRAALADAVRTAMAWPADAIRLDAWDADAGAGPFYGCCGYTERGRGVYRGTPLIFYEKVLPHMGLNGGGDR